MSEREPLRLPSIRAEARPGLSLPGFLGAALTVAFAAAMTEAARDLLPERIEPLLLLTSVLLSAAGFGFWLGIVSALGAFAAFNFLFLEPRYTFHVTHTEDVLMLAVFMLAAGLTGLLAGRLREQVDAAEGRAAVLEVLTGVGHDLAGADSPEAALAAATKDLAELTLGPALALAREGEGLRTVAAAPPGTVASAADLLAADQALRHKAVEYAAEPGWVGSRYTFHPIGGDEGPALVLGHARIDPGRKDCRYREQGVTVLLRQTRLALQRLAFASRAEAERHKAEAEALRAALLASLSHDLRTPLATILGAVTTLREFAGTLPAEARADLLAAIEEEARRLARYVEKLLQMTRLQAGLSVGLAWIDVADVASSAVERTRRSLPCARIEMRLPDLPMIRAEPGLLEQALVNLIENAHRYAGGTVRLEGRVEAGELQLAVLDEGEGLPAPVADWLAQPFAAGVPPGSGLGLAICKGIAQALGGRLWAGLGPGGHGTAMRLGFPIPQVDA